MIARKPLVSSPMSQSIAKPDAKLAPQQGAAPDGVHRLSITHIYPGTLTGTQVVARLESVMIPCLAPNHRWSGADGRSNGRMVDRKSTRLNSVTNAHLVCSLLL